MRLGTEDVALLDASKEQTRYHRGRWVAVTFEDEGLGGRSRRSVYVEVPPV